MILAFDIWNQNGLLVMFFSRTMFTTLNKADVCFLLIS